MQSAVTARCTGQLTPFEQVLQRRVHSRCSGTRSPDRVRPSTAFGTTVYPARTPVNPPFFEKLRNSMAHRSAPGISNTDRGSAGSRTYDSYAAS